MVCINRNGGLGPVDCSGREAAGLINCNNPSAPPVKAWLPTSCVDLSKLISLSDP